MGNKEIKNLFYTLKKSYKADKAMFFAENENDSQCLQFTIISKEFNKTVSQ